LLHIKKAILWPLTPQLSYLTISHPASPRGGFLFHTLPFLGLASVLVRLDHLSSVSLDEMMPLQRAKEQNTMPKLVIALAIAVVGARPVVASQETDVMAPVRQFVDGFNKSDIEMAQAACADQTVIIDDFPPHEWRGSGATSKWFRDLARMGKKNGMSDSFVTLLKPRSMSQALMHIWSFRLI
jgi:hypothetical protein